MITINMPRGVAAFRQRMGAGGDNFVGDARRQKPARPQFRGSDGKPLKKPGIQGFAAIYETTFSANGRLRFLKSGAISEGLYDQNKLLLLDHKGTRQVGSSATGLEFANTSKHSPVNGLAFRMPLSEDNLESALIYNTIKELNRPCVSVGLKMTDYETIIVSGYEVDVVSMARLEEISLCYEGAVPGTNATIVDLENEDPWLLYAARSDSFVRDKLNSNIQSGCRRIVDKLQRLKSEIRGA